MTDFLIRHFIPNADDVRDQKVRERYGVLSGFVGIICNVLLFAMKLAIGLLTGAISIAADAINNLSDGLSCLISLIGFKLAGKAPDEKHPFGYGRTEYLAGFVVAFLICMVGAEFAKTSVDRIFHPTTVKFSPVLLVILAATMLVKLWMGLFNREMGNRIDSTVLRAAMQDSINDVITTSVVLIGQISAQFTTLPIDGYVGLLVALFIIWAGVGIARDTLSPLIGQAADPEIAAQIEHIVLSYDEITGVHDLIIHNYGAGKSLASLHAEVPADGDILALHEVIDAAEKRVWQELGIYLVIHMDPISVNDERVDALRTQVLSVLHALDSRLSMHDFRIVDGEHQINLIFDVVVPFDYSVQGRDKLRGQIEELLQVIDSRYHPVITLDHQM